MAPKDDVAIKAELYEIADDEDEEHAEEIVGNTERGMSPEQMP